MSRICIGRKREWKRNIEKDIVSINPIFIEIASEIIRLAKIQFDHVDEKYYYHWLTISNLQFQG